MKTIINFPNYSITKDGRVWSKKRVDTNNHKRGGHWMRLKRRKDRRVQINLRKNNHYYMKYVHHLVLETFVGKQYDNTEACHSDGNASNNNLSNLRWDTHSSNVKDAVRHGTHCGLKYKGEQHNKAKLTKKDVKYIYNVYWDGAYNQSEIARYFNIWPHTVWDIVNKKTWKHVSK